MTLKPAVDAKVLHAHTSSHNFYFLVQQNRRTTLSQMTPQYNAGPSASVYSTSLSRHYEHRLFITISQEFYTWAFLVTFVVIVKTINTVDYLNIIEDKMNPYMMFFVPTGYGYLQQDNA